MGFRAVAELQVDDAGFLFGAGPAEGFGAFRLAGGDERGDVFADAKAPVNFVVDIEIAESGGDGMIFVGDFDFVIDVVLVTDLIRDDAAFAVLFGVAAADDAFVIGSMLVGNEGVMQDDEADAFVEHREEFCFLGVGDFFRHVVEDDDVVFGEVFAVEGVGVFFVFGVGETDLRIFAEDVQERIAREAVAEIGRAHV